MTRPPSPPPGPAPAPLAGGPVDAAVPGTLSEWADRATDRSLRRAYRLLVGSAGGYWERDLRTEDMWYSTRFFEVLDLPPLPTREEVNQRIHPEDKPRFDQAYRRAIDTLGEFSIDLRYLNRHRQYRWVRAVARVWPGSDGLPERMIGMITDVHAEKEALQRLQELAQRFDRAMAASSEAHFERTLGPAVDQFFVSPRLCSLLGYPVGAQPLSLETLLLLVAEDDRPPLQQHLSATLPDHGTWQHDCRLRHQDGSHRWFRARGRSDLDGQGLLRITGMLGDIHEQSLARQELLQHRERLENLVAERTGRLEQALAEARLQHARAEQEREYAHQADAAKSRFLAHMSHELRTPLNGLLGLNELALRNARTPQQRRLLRMALQSGQSLLDIINDVLDFSRLSAAPLPLKEASFDLADALAATVRSVVPTLRGRDIELMFDYVGEIHRVEGDVQRLQQIVTNLLGNAAKFTPRGEVQLVCTVQADASDPDRCRVRIAVQDNGPGMSPELLAQAFEPFVQGDARLSRQHGGTGLGLSIARGLAEALGGRLDLQSVPGSGTVCTLELPLRSPADQRRPLPVPPPGLAWIVARRPAYQQWLARRIQRFGWQAQGIPDLRGLVWQAMQAEQGAPLPDLVVLSESAINEVEDLGALRALLPHANIVLTVRPDWSQPGTEAQARSALMPLLFAPLVPQALADLLGRRGPQAVPVESDMLGLSKLPEMEHDVLVAEDNPVNQIIVQEMVSSMGLRVRLADNGEAAINACRDQAPSLVLMDLQMPGMDGLEATRQLRELQLRGELPAFPVVALTAHATPQDREDCIAAGMVGYLTKPVALSALRKEITRWVEL